MKAHEKLLCPLLKKYCIRKKCAWWRSYMRKKEDIGSCILHYLETGI